MEWGKTVFLSLAAGIVLSAAAAAQAPMRGGTTPGAAPATGSGRAEPCWEVAGISKSAMEQRHAIALQAHGEVQTVCANSALSPEQKWEQIKQIRERERQEMEGLITPTQESALKACQQERGHVAAPHSGHGGGPCGELGAQHPPQEKGNN
jgi:hypothetical protein